MRVGKDSGHGTRLSLISFHGMACRIPLELTCSVLECKCEMLTLHVQLGGE